MKFRAPSSPPVRLQHREGVQPLPPSLARRRPLWLLAADVCVFTLLDLRKVPARLRARAIAERARQLAPFAAAGWHAADHEGEIALWCWDETRVRAAIDAEGAGSTWEVLPEQLFFSPPPMPACVPGCSSAGATGGWCSVRRCRQARPRVP